jgi:outer membrane receptor for ferrienterochelin and colicins
MTAQRPLLISNIATALAPTGLSQAQRDGIATAIVDDLRQNRPELANVATDLRNLGDTTTISPTNVVDLEPLKASFNNTYELGYKGMAGQRVRFDVAAWYQSRGDVATPATIATPSAHMDSASLSGYTQPRIQAILQASGFSAAQAAAISTGIANNLSNSFEIVPMGTVTFDNARLAPGADVLATYRRIDKEVQLWGTDLSLDYLLTTTWTLTGTYGFASTVVFDEIRDQRNAPFTLNAPGHKASLTARYASSVRRVGGEVRGRYMDGFPVNSGVYSSYGTFANPNVAGGTYRYAPVPVNMLVDAGVNWRFMYGGRNALWSVTVTNLLNNERQTFAGVPKIGRMAITRVQYSF